MGKIKVPTQIIWGKQDQVRSIFLGPPDPVIQASEEKLLVIYKVSLGAGFWYWEEVERICVGCQCL